MVSSAISRGRRALAREVAEPAVRAELPAREGPVELEPLFRGHYASIWRLLRRFGVKPRELDDAAQEVFWIAARRLADIRSGSEAAFLYGIALRVASNAHRRTQKQPPLADFDELSDMAAVEPSPEEQVSVRRERALLDAVLDRMPLELRTVFVLFELEGLEVKQIAELEELPVGTASSRLRRAREEFSAIAKRLRAALAARERRGA